MRVETVDKLRLEEPEIPEQAGDAADVTKQHFDGSAGDKPGADQDEIDRDDNPADAVGKPHRGPRAPKPAEGTRELPARVEAQPDPADSSAIDGSVQPPQQDIAKTAETGTGASGGDKVTSEAGMAPDSDLPNADSKDEADGSRDAEATGATESERLERLQVKYAEEDAALAARTAAWANSKNLTSDVDPNAQQEQPAVSEAGRAIVVEAAGVQFARWANSQPADVVAVDNGPAAEEVVANREGLESSTATEPTALEADAENQAGNDLRAAKIDVQTKVSEIGDEGPAEPLTRAIDPPHEEVDDTSDKQAENPDVNSDKTNAETTDNPANEKDNKQPNKKYDRSDVLRQADAIEYLKETALNAEVLEAEEEVEYAKDIEAGLFAEQLIKIADTYDLDIAENSANGRLAELREEYKERLFESLCDEVPGQRKNIPQEKLDELAEQAYAETDQLFEAALSRLVHDEAGDADVLRSDLEQMVDVGITAKQAMIEHNLRWVFALAMKPEPQAKAEKRGISAEDVFFNTYPGLERAVEKFDYTKGYKFSTYSTAWIKQARDRSLMTEARTVAVPVYVWENLKIFDKKAIEMRQKHPDGLNPSDDEVSAELGWGPENIHNYRKATQPLVSTDLEVGLNGEPLGNQIVEDGGYELFEQAAYNELRSRVVEAIKSLPERDREIAIMKFGLGDGVPRTNIEIAKELGVSRERIRQLDIRFKAKLRNKRRPNNLADYADTDW